MTREAERRAEQSKGPPTQQLTISKEGRKGLQRNKQVKVYVCSVYKPGTGRSDSDLLIISY